LVANPGCYATSVILALRPLTKWRIAGGSVLPMQPLGAGLQSQILAGDLRFVRGRSARITLVA